MVFPDLLAVDITILNIKDVICRGQHLAMRPLAAITVATCYLASISTEQAGNVDTAVCLSVYYICLSVGSITEKVVGLGRFLRKLANGCEFRHETGRGCLHLLLRLAGNSALYKFIFNSTSHYITGIM